MKLSFAPALVAFSHLCLMASPVVQGACVDVTSDYQGGGECDATLYTCNRDFAGTSDEVRVCAFPPMIITTVGTLTPWHKTQPRRPPRYGNAKEVWAKVVSELLCSKRKERMVSALKNSPDRGLFWKTGLRNAGFLTVSSKRLPMAAMKIRILIMVVSMALISHTTLAFRLTVRALPRARCSRTTMI